MVRVRCALVTTRCNCNAREVMLVSGNQNQRTITGSGWMAVSASAPEMVLMMNGRSALEHTTMNWRRRARRLGFEASDNE
jgi:hypothetical protein